LQHSRRPSFGYGDCARTCPRLDAHSAFGFGQSLAVVVGQGQGLLILSRFAQRMVGSAAVIVPALALRHWRGIAQCSAPQTCLRLTLSRPALIVGSTGVLLAANGPANDGGAAVRAQDSLPPVPCLSFGSAFPLDRRSN